MARKVTYTCDLCCRPVEFTGVFKTQVDPAFEDRPAISIDVKFTKPGADGEAADLCNACKQQLLQKAIDTL